MFRQRIQSKAFPVASLFLVMVSVSASRSQAQIPDLGIGASLHGKQIFPDDNAWNQDISQLPVDPASNALLTSIGLTTGLHPDFGTVYNEAPNGIPYIVVSGTQATVPILFQQPGESDPGPYPVPSNAPVEGGPNGTDDRHVLVIDRDNWRLYELYSAYPNANFTDWNAYSGAIFDLNTNTPRPEGWTSADAAGLPVFPGLVRYDEVYEQQAILHALRFTVQHSRHGFIYPARHFASSQTGSNLPPMGMRVRLKASFNISGFAAPVQVILKALKKYGMIVADNGSNWYISGAPDSRWNDDQLHTLSQVHGSDFEVVQMGPVTTDTLSIPKNVQATVGAGGITLTWSASAGSTSYNVKRSLTSGGPYTTIWSGTATNATDTSGAAGTPYFYVVSGVNADQQSFDSAEVSATSPPPVQVRGVVVLQDCVAGAVALQPITFTFRTPGTTTTIFTRTLTLASDGTFALNSVPAGHYDLAIQGTKWLRKVLPINTTAGDVTGIAVILPTGDTNHDNSVDIVDFGMLVAAYGATYTPGDPNAPAADIAADLNCDGSIDIVDFSLLTNNYGSLGDP